MDSRVSVLIDIRSKLAGLEQATAGFGQLIKTVAGFAAAYLSARAVVSGAREIITLGGDLDHLSSQTGIAVSSLMTLQQAFEDNGISGQKVGKSINDMQRRLTATLAIIVIVAAFLLPFVAGWMKMPTEIVSDEAPFSMLWGLITFGGGKVVTHAQGFVHGPEFWPTVRMVAGFVFGIKAVSTGSRLF